MAEDTEEAAEENRHVMLFLDLDGCPYCTRMLKESFINDGPTKSYIQNNFDVININVKGSREIAWSEDETYTEKELAQKLNVPYSPTVIILDSEQNIVVRLNGYRNPAKFKQILEYAHNKHYNNMKLTEYLEKVKTKTVYTLQDNPMFKDINDLSPIKTPLAIIFEDGGCFNCEDFHNTILKNKEVKNAFSKFTVVRLNATSDKTIVTPEGHSVSVKDWIKEINLDYRPGMLLYNEGKLISTKDALLYSFHFKELLLYVANSEYKTYPTYLDYLRVKQDELLKQGVDINLAK
jgi:thioredoxin-related protein